MCKQYRPICTQSISRRTMGMGTSQFRVNKRCVVMLLAILSVIILGTLSPFLPLRQDRFSSTELDVWTWYRDIFSICGGNYTAYGHRFFRLQSGLIDPADHRAVAISCRTHHLPPRYFFHGGYALQRYTDSLRHITPADIMSSETSHDFTVAVYREYPHNFYHAMCQWYNLFLLSKFFGLARHEFDVLLLDTGPEEHIDAQWRKLFRKVTKVQQLEKRTVFQNITFSIAGHESPMYYIHQNKLQYIEEFSQDVLRTFELRNDKRLDCARLNVTVVFRRDYLWHFDPNKAAVKRNAERKFKNEAEILSSLREGFPGSNITMMVAEELSLEEQLSLTTRTDVLIGMHGAAMSHSMFLPTHGAVFELYPEHWSLQFFFSSVCKWRGIKHYHWRNSDKSNEFPNHYTYIPLSVVQDYAREIREYLC